MVHEIAIPELSFVVLIGVSGFVRKEPLHRVHEAVFGVLALESGPADPHLC